MKTMTHIIGILLILFGIVSLAYQGFSYSTKKDIVAIGNLKVTEEQQRTIHLPPVVGGVSIVVGIALLALARISKK